MNKRICLSIFLLVIVLQHCSRRIYIKAENYQPTFEKKFSSYNGKTICLPDIIHEAPNADRWFYYSRYYFKTCYEAVPTLETFIKESFKRTFVYIGMNIHEYECPAGVPVTQIHLFSISDKQFQIKVSVLGKGVSFGKVYIVNEPPPESKDKEYLEQRSYRMIGKMIEAILSDQEFTKAISQLN